MQTIPGYVLREISPSETGLFKNFLYLAIYQAEGSIPPPYDIVDEPSLRIYYENFTRNKIDKGDYCLIAGSSENNTSTFSIVGAAWSRILSGEHRGYGNIDASTPELAVSVLPAHRGKGIGTILILTLLERLKEAGFSRVSLSVQKANPAARLYSRLGFVEYENKTDELILIRTL